MSIRNMSYIRYSSHICGAGLQGRHEEERSSFFGEKGEGV